MVSLNWTFVHQLLQKIFIAKDRSFFST